MGAQDVLALRWGLRLACIAEQVCQRGSASNAPAALTDAGVRPQPSFLVPKPFPVLLVW